MKTSEFISRVKILGYDTKACEYWIDVSDRFNLKGMVFTKDFKLSLSTNDINLIKLCLEYAETPIEEREEEKKYTVVLPDSQRRGKRVMALGKLSEYDNEVIILHIKKETLETERCRLTESEIKRNHEYLWQFAKEVTP